MPKLEITKNYDELRDFFIENGLEYDEDEEAPDNIVKMWALRESQPIDMEGAPCSTPRGMKLVAGACLSRRSNGEFVLDGIAVDPAYRKRDYGKKLMELIMDETKKQGGKRLVLVARVPGFYKKLGFASVPDAESPVHFDCIGCPQNGVDCFPEVMLKEVL